MKPENKIDVVVPDKYLKSDIFNPIDELLIGALKCLREQGKSCEFLGFNILNGHVVMIDGIKYYTKANRTYSMETLSNETFLVVSDEEYDYIENRLKERVNQILDT